MAFEQKPNSGSLWPNDKKTQENHPDRTGTLNVGGVEYWISGWIKKTKDGRSYMNLSVKPKQQRSQRRDSDDGGW